VEVEVSLLTPTLPLLYDDLGNSPANVAQAELHDLDAFQATSSISAEAPAGINAACKAHRAPSALLSATAKSRPIEVFPA
jgi:hypothetical protein